ncbi:DNA polymerase alpha catalytic subunit [Amyelois transitella]|uniref:DNA polymerase alpha catalytic subunit n=1 Tax=Amyelois transitella TaxID=680683 RepID=UPI00067BE546|nr:DNA polymerase alpha catalytic subunit [Amyelois transitella]
MADSLAVQRSKRQKVDKHGRLSAFEKLKQLKGKGVKHKYDVDELENVYDTVDEKEYTDRVLQRQDDDWIEDDGTGYVEDGREIFDDDDEIEDTYVATNNKETGRGQKRKARVAAPASSKGNIRNLLGSMPTKKKEDVKISEDNILSDIMSDLDGSAASPVVKPKPLVMRTNTVESSKRDAQNYFKSLASSVKKPTPPISNGQAKQKIENIDKPNNIPTETDKAEKPVIKKTEWKIEKEIKQELEDSATQNIEEFDTQEMVFDDDFSNDNGAATKDAHVAKKAKIKEEPISNTITDVADEFLNDDFEIFPSKEESPKELKPLSSTWGEVGDQQVQAAVMSDGQLPLNTNEDGEKFLRFYWLDAWEDKYVKPGVVYLFGKVYAKPGDKKAGCLSCCVVVKNVTRQMFLLPREYKLDPVTLENTDNEVTMMDVYEEFNSSVANELGLKEFKSRKITKNYCFNLPDIPAQSDYLEVKYSATFPPPPSGKKYLTFSHIFGTNTSSLETFLLDRKIKGPCWLEIKYPENALAKVSWCKLEAAVEKMEHITVSKNNADIEPPPVVVATINMRTTTDLKTRKAKIVMISCLIHNQFPINKPPPNPPFQQHFCVMTKCNEIWPLDLKQAFLQYKATKLNKCDSERELLNYFMVQFWKADPDLVVGHDLPGFQQDLLIGNILDLHIPNWSRLGRLKRSVAPQRKFASKDAFLGRLVCDIKISAMELIRARSFDLNTLCVDVLKMKEGERVDVAIEDLPRYYENSRNLLQLVSLSMQDASYILKIMCELNVLPLALQITQIAGNVMSRTLMGGRSERNEFLLLHAFTEKNFIVPDKVYGKKTVNIDDDNEDGNTENVPKKQAKKKAAYSGGLVLDPKKGFYDQLILLMDFNSLYPSIIQEYNICFTTIKRKSAAATDDDIANLVLPAPNTEFGVLPTQIRKLVESRREVKKLMKSDLPTEQYMQYNIRQMALKLTANSMYGCLGFTHSRFYAKPLAALVTMKGREILMDTKEIVQKLNYDVVYGDTDSLMINTNCLDYDSVFKIGNDLKREINKKYKQIELDIDGVFRYLLLLKKKKYAAVIMNKNKNGTFVYTQEHKGLDIVRRDWSQLAAEAGKFILSKILSELSADERLETIQTYLGKIKEDLTNGKMPLSMLTITKQLTKHPNEYADKNLQPHVQVALRLNSKNSRRFKKGDIVPYIICDDGTGRSAVQRAYHIEELKSSDTLKVDNNYYLAHQLHPVISRICEPIDGMDPARIADWLGLDPSGYKQMLKRQDNNTDTFEVENEQEKYRHCKDFVFVCVNEGCKTENRIRETFVKGDKDSVCFLERCQNEKCGVRPMDYVACVQNQLSLQIRQCHGQYYAGWLACEDPACALRSRRLPRAFAGGRPLCPQCEKGVMFREYTEKDLYLQINFFMFLFDLSKNNSKIKVPHQVAASLQVLKETVEDWLAQSAYSIINLSKLFRFFTLDPNSGNNLKSEPLEIDIMPETEQIDALLEIGIY